MRLPQKNPTRHPAVIDTLGGTQSTRQSGRGPLNLPPKVPVVLGCTVIAAAGWLILRPSATPPESPPAPPAATAEPTSTGPAPTDCRKDAGDQNSGAGTIAAFQYAYYTTRSAAAARALTTPTSTVLAADALQPIIDAVPRGTTYCLRLAPIGNDAYVMALTITPPGQPEETFTQTVTTKNVEGKWLIDTFK